MEIKREKYLNDLVNRMHNGMIKVITGIRRCGKSFTGGEGTYRNIQTAFR